MNLDPSTVVTRLTHLAQTANTRLRVRSALNPLLWLCGLGVPTCLGFALVFEEPLRTVLVYTGCGMLGFGCLAFAFLAIFKADKLQSEEYQLRRAALELIEEKGGRIAIEAASVESIANPELPALPEGREARE